MNSIVRALLVVVLLAIGTGAAHAQTWVGLRTGYPLGITAHVGMENAVSGVADLRVSGRVESIRGSTRVGVALDFLRTVSTETPFDVYVGGGPAISLGGGAAFFEVHGLVGGEYRLIDIELSELGIFAELSLGAEIDAGGGGNARLPTFGAAFGFNWHF